MAEWMNPSQMRELMIVLAKAMGIDANARQIRRLTLVMDAESLMTLYVEEYPSGEVYGDLHTGFRTLTPGAVHVVDGPPPKGD